MGFQAKLISILIQPEGGMQRGKTLDIVVAAEHVSILIQPEGRMQLDGRCQSYRGLVLVSILTQPEGWMQRGRRRSRPPGSSCFNPHPARRPDATPASRGEGKRIPVSILTQPEGRMQRPAMSLMVCNPSRFQSSPSPKAGCNGSCGHHITRWFASFNPHPARRPDATTNCRRWSAIHQGFNPHPARRPDATGAAGITLPGGSQVSILTQPEGRMQQRTAGAGLQSIKVSILTQPEGRMQPSRLRSFSPSSTFQSSPSPKAGCNTRLLFGFAAQGLFQSSPSPKAGCNPWAPRFG